MAEPAMELEGWIVRIAAVDQGVGSAVRMNQIVVSGALPVHTVHEIQIVVAPVLARGHWVIGLNCAVMTLGIEKLEGVAEDRGKIVEGPEVVVLNGMQVQIDEKRIVVVKVHRSGDGHLALGNPALHHQHAILSPVREGGRTDSPEV